MRQWLLPCLFVFFCISLLGGCGAREEENQEPAKKRTRFVPDAKDIHAKDVND